MDSPSADYELPSLNATSNKHRRKKSKVWEYFTVETIGAGCIRACCKRCKKSFAYISGSKLAGTSHLKRHIALGICPGGNNQENKQLTYTPVSISGDIAGGNGIPRKRYRANPVVGTIPFNQGHSNYELAKMIIMNSLPLDIAEQPGFIDFVRTLQPQFSIIRFNTTEADCLGIYLREKQSLLSLISELPGRVSLTIDLWTSDQTVGYALLTGHFVDINWKLQHRIVNVITIPFPNSEVFCYHAVATCLTEWNLDGKLFTLTFDESFADKTVKENMRGLLSIRNPLTLGGQLLIGNCYSHVLSSLAQDALGSMDMTINRVRESVKYVKSSEAIKVKFMELKRQLQVPSMKSLITDDVTKWNTTYDMLVVALELKDVFSCLGSSDANYKEAPSTNEWKQVEILCMYLKLLFDAANTLMTKSYPTANSYFHEVWKIQLELTNASMKNDIFISDLIKPLRERFDKYWKDTILVLAIAVVMDPRFKMKLVEFSFSRLYGETADTWVKIVDEGIHEVFLEYIVQSLPAPTFVHEGNDIVAKTEFLEEETLFLDCDGLSDFDVYLSEITSSQQVKSELDQYLEESLLPRVQDFDVLGWWKVNRMKYPTLSRMAADILMIPVSTVGPDSVFDIVSKKMDSYQTSLRPATLEALICAKDWLQYGSTTTTLSNAIVKVEY